MNFNVKTPRDLQPSDLGRDISVVHSATVPDQRKVNRTEGMLVGIEANYAGSPQPGNDVRVTIRVADEDGEQNIPLRNDDRIEVLDPIADL